MCRMLDQIQQRVRRNRTRPQVLFVPRSLN
ncbi:hypothetical protein WG66_016761 [Moniliophthora roreri]|nr:hypothetical protein WG66_016761 [Moniliophthora roreri]